MKTKMESICSVPRSPPQVPCVLRSFRFLLQGLEGKDHSIMVSVLVRVPEEHPERFSFMMVTMVLHCEELSFSQSSSSLWKTLLGVCSHWGGC